MSEPGIIIVGLGPGDPGYLTRRAWDVLAAADTVWLRTRQHPTVAHLPEGPEYQSFDAVYEDAENFRAVYGHIVDRLLAMANEGRVVYAVPGDPMVAEGTVTGVLAGCRARGIDVEIVSGVSFIEPTLAVLGVDAVPGLQLIDALDVAALYHPPINPDYPALVAQVYSRQVASDVKLTLMNQYADEHEVMLVHGAGSGLARVERLPLYEIDRHESAHLTSLYVPPVAASPNAVVGFQGFQNTIAHLRSPDGCPWDREQSHKTLTKHLLEEAYEVVEAIETGQVEELASELGDLLLQVVLQTQVAIDEGEFTMTDVIASIDAKMKRRHPHVWGDVDVGGDAGKVLANWEEIKAAERAEKRSGDDGASFKSVLDGVGRHLPSLATIHEYDLRAAKLGFDWQVETGVIEKVQEEVQEVIDAQTDAEKFHEIGDVLVAVAVWARWLDINPEAALRAATRRFYRRFTYVERRAGEMGRSLDEMTLEEMEALWQEVKAQEQ